jgi:hypothetical protein
MCSDVSSLSRCPDNGELMPFCVWGKTPSKGIRIAARVPHVRPDAKTNQDKNAN